MSNADRVRAFLNWRIRLIQRPDQYWECSIGRVDAPGPPAYRAYQIACDPLDALMGAVENMERLGRWQDLDLLRPMWEAG